jgi:hypothetical protein
MVLELSSLGLWGIKPYDLSWSLLSSDFVVVVN